MCSDTGSDYEHKNLSVSSPCHCSFHYISWWLLQEQPAGIKAQRESSLPLLKGVCSQGERKFAPTVPLSPPSQEDLTENMKVPRWLSLKIMTDHTQESPIYSQSTLVFMGMTHSSQKFLYKSNFKRICWHNKLKSSNLQHLSILNFGSSLPLSFHLKRIHSKKGKIMVRFTGGSTDQKLQLFSLERRIRKDTAESFLLTLSQNPIP